MYTRKHWHPIPLCPTSSRTAWPVAHHMTWMHQLGTSSEKPFWHFSKIPTGLIPHPLYQTMSSSEEPERKGEMDKLTFTDNNEFPEVSTYTHTPNSIPQPPSSYCVPHNYSHSKTTPHCLGSAVQPPTRNNSETAENRKWEGYEAASTAGDAWVRPRTISGRLPLEGETESGTRWALRGEYITRLKVISY